MLLITGQSYKIILYCAQFCRSFCQEGFVFCATEAVRQKETTPFPHFPKQALPMQNSPFLPFLVVLVPATFRDVGRTLRRNGKYALLRIGS